jgi:ABC-type cobalamin/Fe3+-siderophores transport system ATPase subunit
MRLDKVYIDGFKNLNDCRADFDENRLTTVVIGQNGAGKSNLIEAIVDIFRCVDVNQVPTIRYRFEIEYRLNGDRHIKISNLNGKSAILCNGVAVSRAAFDREKSLYFPDLVFGYYSGGSRRLEGRFDSHQRRYYDVIKISDDLDACRKALMERRLFYCRPIHGNLALLSFFAHPRDHVAVLLKDKLGITGFHSSLTVFRQPWFSKVAKSNATEAAHDLWDAKGPAGVCARAIRELAFHPIAIQDNPIDDYREKANSEAQLGAFFPGESQLTELAKRYPSDQELFYAMEAMDISDLIREVHLWVNRTNNNSGDVSFADLSDGERQLLMVLGLIRVSRGKRALFLLDEPDTHLNPHWQHTYLQLIKEWTEIAADDSSCHIIMTSHNPLTICALHREEVRIMTQEDSGKVTVSPPYTDPSGLGFTTTLTEIFGMSTSVDIQTQKLLDIRNDLANKSKRSDDQERSLISINDKLDRLGFMFEDREPLYQEFLRSWHDVRYADRPPMTPSQIEHRRMAMKKLIQQLMDKRGIGS